MAARTIAWLARLDARGATVLIGDPGRSYLPRERLEALAIYEVPVTRALEDSDFKTTHVWRFRKD
jgi:predicted nicotinamide N-methyase